VRARAHTHTHTHTQVLDPDFYVSTTEQVPRMLMEFLIPPGGDEDGPFVGRLEVSYYTYICVNAAHGIFYSP
jgi:hypothetical protein